MSDHIALPEGSIEKLTTTLNLGPTHPATHGVFQNILEVDGERVLKTDPTIGYIHRAFEKIAERRPYYQVTPLTDRLNYCSAPINNIGWQRRIAHHDDQSARCWRCRCEIDWPGLRMRSCRRDYPRSNDIGLRKCRRDCGGCKCKGKEAAMHRGTFLSVNLGYAGYVRK